ncbi:hypothetical protein [Blastomonas aquatica]|uniref:Ig-like domain-containing protein n=1 Tax=Blastomonas aquatica TaxID=1510276 RepID=A0ABQ1J8M1_9SPHN|nr:hypothetical protein [Blastomonas aquatica]GGB60440.1 hypothetical protein GCM10010833_14150 [Blastomonas aquatica]
MIKSLMVLTLSAQAPTYAPFILQQEDAVYVDDKIDLKKCHFDKSGYTRWYWFDAIARNSKYIIDRTTVRFAVVDDKKSRVIATAPPPFDAIKVKFKAIGTYKLVSEKTEVTCA